MRDTSRTALSTAQAEWVVGVGNAYLFVQAKTPKAAVDTAVLAKRYPEATITTSDHFGLPCGQTIMPGYTS